MSHFARADEPDHPFNQTQINRLLDAHRLIKERFPFARISLNNSAAAWRECPISVIVEL